MTTYVDYNALRLQQKAAAAAARPPTRWTAKKLLPPAEALQLQPPPAPRPMPSPVPARTAAATSSAATQAGNAAPAAASAPAPAPAAPSSSASASASASAALPPSSAAPAAPSAVSQAPAKAPSSARAGKGKGSGKEKGLSANARAFVPVEDFVPSYRPPQQQPYQQVEQAMQQQQQQQSASASQHPAAAKPQPILNPPAPVVPAPAAASDSRASAAQQYLIQQHAMHAAMQQQVAPAPVQLQQQVPVQGSQSQRAPRKQRQRQPQAQPQENVLQQQYQQQQQQQQHPRHSAQSQSPSTHPSHRSTHPPASSPRGDGASHRGIPNGTAPHQPNASQRGRGGRNNRGGGRGGHNGMGGANAAPFVPSAAAEVPDADPAAASASATSSAAAAPLRAGARGVPREPGWREGHVDNSMLAKTITEQLMTNAYECSICSSVCGRRDKIWSCDCCHIILHLKCIHKWYETNRAQSLGDTSFRCPGCMFVRTEPPGEYRCFCGKIFEPDSQPFLTPHSCGQICGKSRNCGVHTCNLPCHPGHCAKCTVAGPLTTCACGATEHRLKCGEEGLEKPTCDGVCGKELACGEHRCEAKCHNGSCTPCSSQLDLSCFCGQVSETRVCGQAGTVVDPDHPERKSFACENTCNKQLACGQHQCKERCHAGPCQPCTRVPPTAEGEVQACACGKEQHSLEEIESTDALSRWKRSSCTAALPTCGAKCGRLLNCSFHTCTLVCHDPKDVPCGTPARAPASGSSSSSSSSSARAPSSVGCTEMVKRQCRCAAQNVVDVPCTTIRGDTLRGTPPASHLAVLCDTKCRAKLACKKHTCQQTCCPRGESHVCVRVCGKPLDCGRHTCDAHCHIGACKPCAVVFRDGVLCECGRTSSGRNTKCGTPLPPCPYPCSRQRECGHRCIQTCHENPCAPCVVLTNKMCAGGHRELKSVPCFAQPSCGVTCNRLLRCGTHACKRPCHAGKCTVALGSQMPEVRKGWAISPAAPSAAERKEAEEDAHEEEDDGSVRSCNQKCGLKRSDCGHPCGAACHPGQPCPTNVACREPSRIYCDCKRISKLVPCAQEGGVALRALPCTTQCELETRNARFRDALQLDDSAPRIPYPSELLDQVIQSDLFDFVVRSERALSDFLAASSASSKTFAVMPTAQRWVLHQLASYYYMDSESFDPEPRRSVRVIKTAASQVPKMKLSDAIKLYREAKAGKAGATTARVTLAQSTVIHLFDLDQEPRIAPSDLALALKPYSLDYGGERNHNFRINFLDNSHALIIFHDPQLASNIRANLVARKLFALEPDEQSSKKAVDAWRTQYRDNALFRRRHETGGVASVKKLTHAPAAASASASSSFDDWSTARSSAVASKLQPPSPPASWDSAGERQSEAEFNALLERTKRESLASTAAASASPHVSASPAPASSSVSLSVSPMPVSTFASASPAPVAGVVSLSQPKLVSTTNAWSALGDEEEAEEEEEGEEEEEKEKEARKQQGDEAQITAGEWEEAAAAGGRPARKQGKQQATAPVLARSAFDD